MSTRPKFSSLSDATGLDVVDLSRPGTSRCSPTNPSSRPTRTPSGSRSRSHGRVGFGVLASLPYVIPAEIRAPNGDHRTSISLPETHELAREECLIYYPPKKKNL